MGFYPDGLGHVSNEERLREVGCVWRCALRFLMRAAAREQRSEAPGWAMANSKALGET